MQVKAEAADIDWFEMNLAKGNLQAAGLEPDPGRQ
jgi:hypothetical protein